MSDTALAEATTMYYASSRASASAYNTLPWPAVDPEVVMVTHTDRPAVPTDLGLALIRGPVSYLFLEPKPQPPGSKSTLPTLVLLGDVHAPEYCELACEDAGGFVSAAADTKCVSAQDRTHNTFLTYLDETFGALTPDVFVEKWTTQAKRRGEQPRTDTSGDSKPGPLANFTFNALPCAYHKDRSAIIDGVDTPCPYANLRVHVADQRHDFTNGFLVLNMLRSTSAHVFATYVGMDYPGVSAADVVRSALDPNPRKFFVDPFYLQFSRVSHELKQLAPAVASALLEAIGAVEFPSPFPPEFEPAVLAWLAGPGDAYLPPLTRALASVYADNQMQLAVSCMALDLYFIARALKVTKDGKRSSLAVAYFGDLHVQSIAFLLTRSHLYGLKKMVVQGGPGTPSHRCLLLGSRKIALAEPPGDSCPGGRFCVAPEVIPARMSSDTRPADYDGRYAPRPVPLPPTVWVENLYLRNIRDVDTLAIVLPDADGTLPGYGHEGTSRYLEAMSYDKFKRRGYGVLVVKDLSGGGDVHGVVRRCVLGKVRAPPDDLPAYDQFVLDLVLHALETDATRPRNVLLLGIAAGGLVAGRVFKHLVHASPDLAPAGSSSLSLLETLTVVTLGAQYVQPKASLVAGDDRDYNSHVANIMRIDDLGVMCTPGLPVVDKRRLRAEVGDAGFWDQDGPNYHVVWSDTVPKTHGWLSTLTMRRRHPDKLRREDDGKYHVSDIVAKYGRVTRVLADRGREARPPAVVAALLRLGAASTGYPADLYTDADTTASAIGLGGGSRSRSRPRPRHNHDDPRFRW